MNHLHIRSALLHLVALSLSSVALVVWHGGTVHAQATGPSVTADRAAPAAEKPSQQPSDNNERPSTFDSIWGRLTRWYTNDDNPLVQQVLFSGRFQHDFAAIGSDAGDHDESNVRRVRLGPRVTLFRDFTAHVELEVNPQERDPFYMRVTDAYLQWHRNRHLVMTFGKQGVPFTSEGSTSSKELLTIDRSNLANNIWFPQEYMPGVSVSGRIAPWIYRGGVYSAGAMNREFGEFSGDYFTLAAIGYDFTTRLSAKDAVLTGNYVYQHPDSDNSFTRQLEHVLSVHLKLDMERWGLRTDVSNASGAASQSDMRALMVMPYVNVSNRLQAVSRYTYINSDDPNGIRFGTYESRIVSGRGDEYNDVYLGVNYYLYGHKLKLQSGVQWADMQDRIDDGGEYSGVSWTTGLRVGW